MTADDSLRDMEEERPIDGDETEIDAKTEAELEANTEDDEENKLKSEFDELNDRYVRLYAEYENFRKRSKKERDLVYTEVRADTIIRFLPVYDSLARALALLPVYDGLARALEQELPDEAHRRGVEMTMAQMKEVLEKLGVSEIPAVGEKFDPALHDAVMHTDDPDKGEGEIVEEFEKGFLLGDKVIRFSLVKVAN